MGSWGNGKLRLAFCVLTYATSGALISVPGRPKAFLPQEAEKPTGYR